METTTRLYRATCTTCGAWSVPLEYRAAVDWTVLHAEDCPDASTELWDAGLDLA